MEHRSDHRSSSLGPVARSIAERPLYRVQRARKRPPVTGRSS
ncbi:hypothetical protein LF41_1450 [Lysobacter dokdonensis DS-58]|uniref:Uncharacterized protein n=1 Tax=Lysobacter dokdonensis DS-58 TaxID=1300345 RepID=A0A0A2WD30_9GAMM|nr:hypothetical protein LF41_1450 [Lysobacter dokdonensis DS-58]